MNFVRDVWDSDGHTLLDSRSLCRRTCSRNIDPLRGDVVQALSAWDLARLKWLEAGDWITSLEDPNSPDDRELYFLNP